MSLVIDFSPQEESLLASVARQAGIAPAEYVKNIIREHLPSTFSTQETDPFLTMLKSRLAQAPTDPEKVQEAEEDLNEFMRSMNQTRREAGERILYPEAE